MIISIFEHILIHSAFSTVLISLLISLYFILFVVDEIGQLSDSSDTSILITFFCLTGFLYIHCIASGHFPLSNFSESFVFFSWSFCFIQTIPYFRNNTKFLYTVTNLSIKVIQAFATSFFLKEIKPDSIVVPGLQSEWLIMHVSMMIMGYAILICGSLLSISFLVVIFRTNQKFFLKTNSLCLANNYCKSQLSEELDFWSSRIISLGFIFLTLGLVSGAVWANEAWGSYWSWDPKEIWSFITWLVFTLYLHIRKNQNFTNTISALVASIGFLIIWICYFGVNLIGLGFHSYGFFH